MKLIELKPMVGDVIRYNDFVDHKISRIEYGVYFSVATDEQKKLYGPNYTDREIELNKFHGWEFK